MGESFKEFLMTLREMPEEELSLEDLLRIGKDSRKAAPLRVEQQLVKVEIIHGRTVRTYHEYRVEAPTKPGEKEKRFFQRMYTEDTGIYPLAKRGDVETR